MEEENLGFSTVIDINIYIVTVPEIGLVLKEREGSQHGPKLAQLPHC